MMHRYIVTFRDRNTNRCVQIAELHASHAEEAGRRAAKEYPDLAGYRIIAKVLPANGGMSLEEEG